jgi:hypothetical protein
MECLKLRTLVLVGSCSHQFTEIPAISARLKGFSRQEWWWEDPVFGKAIRPIVVVEPGI